MTAILLLVTLLSAPAMGQSGSNNQALADCVQAADQKYKDTWEALRTPTGESGLLHRVRRITAG